MFPLGSLPKKKKKMFPLGLLFEQLKSTDQHNRAFTWQEHSNTLQFFNPSPRSSNEYSQNKKPSPLPIWVPRKKEKHFHNFHSLPNGRWNLQSLMNPRSWYTIIPWHISASNCEQWLHTWLYLSCTCERSQEQVDHQDLGLSGESI